MIVKASTSTLNIAVAALIIKDFNMFISNEAFSVAITNLVFLVFTLINMIINSRQYGNISSLVMVIIALYNLIFDCFVIHRYLNGQSIDKDLHNMAMFIAGFNTMEFLYINIKR